MPPIRVLVVDDSAVVRRFIVDRLESDTDVAVVGQAADGRSALEAIRATSPDVVILDDEMPGLRGRDILKRVREDHPTIAVVMFSASFHDGPLGTFDALYLGADDGVAKPSAGSGRVGHDHPVWDELLVKTKRVHGNHLRGGTAAKSHETATPAGGSDETRPNRHRVAGAKTATSPNTGTVASAPLTPSPGAARRAVLDEPAAVLIGSSTGGPDALGVLLTALPADFPLPVLVAQHMPPVFTRLLAERLDAKAALDVREATHGETIRPGLVLIAPGDQHLTVKGNILGHEVALTNDPPEHSCRPAVDPLFRTAASAYGARTVALVLSGMGSDGLDGSRHVRAAGGHVIAQDEATSVVWGMPGFVAREGIAQDVLPLHDIAPELIRRARALAADTASRKAATS